MRRIVYVVAIALFGLGVAVSGTAAGAVELVSYGSGIDSYGNH